MSGCSDSRDWAPVSGRVTLDGEPQEGIFIYFEPELPAGVDPLKGVSKSYARTDAEGQYTLNFMDAERTAPEHWLDLIPSRPTTSGRLTMHSEVASPPRMEINI